MADHRFQYTYLYSINDYRKSTDVLREYNLLLADYRKSIFDSAIQVFSISYYFCGCRCVACVLLLARWWWWIIATIVERCGYGLHTPLLLRVVLSYLKSVWVWSGVKKKASSAGVCHAAYLYAVLELTLLYSKRYIVYSCVMYHAKGRGVPTRAYNSAGKKGWNKTRMQGGERFVSNEMWPWPFLFVVFSRPAYTHLLRYNRPHQKT
jgi:hypothetical protein